MLLTFAFAILFAVAFFSAENIVTVVIGAVISAGLAQWVKGITKAYGPIMLIIAVVISLIVALAAIVVSSLMNGTPLDWSALPQYGSQLFALATIGYKLFIADSEN